MSEKTEEETTAGEAVQEADGETEAQDIELPEEMQEMFTMELEEAEGEQIKKHLGSDITWLTVTNVPRMAEQVQDDRFAGGPEAIARLFSALDHRTITALLQRIEEGGKRLVEQIRRQMFPFNDLVYLKNLDLELVLRGIENSTIAMAIRIVPDEVKQRIFSCVPSAKRMRIEEEIGLFGQIPEDDRTPETQERINQIHQEIETAQGTIVSAILNAERQKKIKIVRPKKS